MTIVLNGARARISVAPPPVARGGFLAAAQVIDLAEGDHAIMGAQYLTDACNVSNAWNGPWCVPSMPSQCTEPVAAVPNPKLFDASTTVVEGDPFVVTAGSECDLASLADRLAAATAAFNYGERRQVDAAFAAWLAAHDVETGVSGSTECALGGAEQWLADAYGGVGLIAIPIEAALSAIARGLVRGEPGGLVTALGTPVAAYAADATGTEDAWAMGQVTLLRGPIKSFSVPPMMRADGSCVPARALAERAYVPLVECVVGHFTVTCCPCSTP